MNRVVYYDGYCNLCSYTVRWIIRNDRKRQFSFQPLKTNIVQEAEGQTRDRMQTGDGGPGATVILEEGGKRYERSTAAIRIALGLRFPWPLLGILFLLPPFLRDPVYDLVARHRYRWFGRRSTCYITPTSP